ncbi:MAG: hypothetical protein IJ566_00560 [Cardiobacteriaceae bacterium]|nr:hypothetical protein [Cardiobacteriaceae bacterium]
MKKEKTVLFLFASWSAILLFFAVIFLSLLAKNAPPKLPFPKEFREAEIIFIRDGEQKIRFNFKNSAWQSEDGQKEEKFPVLLGILAKSCYEKYPRSEIKINPTDEDLILVFNGGEKWFFGAHNAVKQRHFLRIGESVYSCNEQIKPRLEQLFNNKK